MKYLLGGIPGLNVVDRWRYDDGCPQIFACREARGSKSFGLMVTFLERTIFAACTCGYSAAVIVSS